MGREPAPVSGVITPLLLCDYKRKDHKVDVNWTRWLYSEH